VGEREPAETTAPEDTGEGGGRLLRLLSHPVPRLVLLVGLLVVATVLALRADDLSVAALRGVVEEAGPLAPVAYGAMYAAAVTVMLPAAPLTVAAGILFGPVVGVITVLAGATTGAVGAFGVARFVGRGPVERLTGRRARALDRFVAERGLIALLLLRLVPVIPFSVLNLVAGVTALRLRDYTIATALGIVPATVAFVAVGGTLDDPTSPAFLVAIGLLVVVTVGGALGARRLRQRDLEATTS
jgi:uncharacterized membrane protein YdjX (TVP38/TMEM64 family)